MKAAYIETTGGPEVIRYGDLPDAEPQAGRGPGQGRRVGAQSDRPLHPRRHGGHAAAQAVHPRLRPGRHGRGGRPGAHALQAGRPRLGLEPGPARPAGDLRRVRLRRTRTGSIRPRPASADEEAAAVALVGITAHLGLFRCAKLQAGRDGLRQRRHRRRRLDGRADGQGRRGAASITTVGSAEKAALCRELGRRPAC